MYLKTLALAGFKSFADRTRLDLEPGVNVVVGPNGSGKSNLVDAVAWVLGTQATSALRTQKMDELIFSGTALRPPHSRAEVSLTFDNGEGRLPLDLPDVTITRRLYRDGSSDYEINGTACRLLDIQELLADGGVGRHQHVIVGQGRIGTILNARPDEHRSVIEEAAGVVKHRNRRDRSLRRLEQTDVDLTRLHDILQEQQRRMRPLRRQARAAERHDDLKAELRALRLWLGGEALREFHAQIEHATTETAAVASTLESAERDLRSLREAFPSLEIAAGEAGRALERDTAAAARLETSLERLTRIGMVARERRLAAESRLRGAGDRRRDLEEELERLDADLVVQDEAVRRAALDAEQREAALRSLEDEERLLAEQAQLPAEGVVATLRGDLRGLEAADERDRRELAALEERLTVLGHQLADGATDTERLRVEIRRTDGEASAASAAFTAASDQAVADRSELDAAEHELRRAQVELAGASARLEALEAAAAGLGDPAGRELATARDEVVGTVIAALDVPDELAAAVDAALGVWADALVTDALAAVVSAVKSEGLGGVGLVASGEEAQPRAVIVAAESGVDALVDRLGPAASRRLAAQLLGDVVLVEGWSMGLDLVTRYRGLRAVTPEGDLITAAGIRVATPDGAGPGALQAAAGGLEAAEIELRRAESRQATAARTFDRSSTAERAALERLERLEAVLAGSTEALAVLGRARTDHEAEQRRLGDRRMALTDAAADRAVRIADARKRLGEFEGEEAARQQAWEEIAERRSEVAERRDAARQQREDAAGRLAAGEERSRMLRSRREHIGGELAQFAAPKHDDGLIDRLAAIEHHARAALDLVRGHVATLRERQRARRVEAGSAGEALGEAHQTERRMEAAIATSKERSAELRLTATELELRRESVAEGLRRDADATEDEALGAARPELAAEQDPVELVESLAGQLRRMGPINPLAAAEYRELAERAEFLEGQIHDLEESRTELRKVIAALDEQIGVQFAKAFEEIDAIYQENFRLLFPGGNGRLRLTVPEDLLATGVEIEAQPLGKKVTRLALLSGGERSLAALAFLFAVFRARPSPFYLLDEVEAALDDTNLRRFLRLVDTLRGSAQLAIVTHQQHTMEAADILYGVTMEPGESSQVVAKRLVQPGV